MVRTKIIMIVFSFYVGTCASCQIGKVKEKLNLNDSASVRNFIKTSTVCDRLKFMEENLTLFVSDCLYSRLILESITEETGKTFFLVISNGGILESHDNQINKLREQIFQIMKIECKFKPRSLDFYDSSK